MYILAESKQSIINLGYPEIVAKLYYAEFGNKAYLLARWYQEYQSAGLSDNHKKDWFKMQSSAFGKGLSIWDYVLLYNGITSNNQEEYLKLKKRLELSTDPLDEFEIKEEKEFIINELKEKLFQKNVFFRYYDLVKDIISGKIKNISEYEKLFFKEAVQKYDSKKLFRDQVPYIKYKNGYRWIDAGTRCPLVGDKLKNCGGIGVMGTDPDRHMYVLFDEHDNPHVVVTHSPNEKLLNGIEGAASSEIKDIYVKYVLHLAKKLKVSLKNNVKKYLLIKYVFKNVSRLMGAKKESLYFKYYKLEYKNEIYVSDGTSMILKSDFKKIYDAIKSKNLKLKYNTRNAMRDTFDFYNRPFIVDQMHINFIDMNQIIYKHLEDIEKTMHSSSNNNDSNKQQMVP